jgi:para-aminobenzoate synthetase/4-amino-4-deoxychorismate lyase
VEERQAPFVLLEALLWEPDAGYFLLDRHLRRLAGAARRFGVPLDEAQVAAELQAAARGLRAPAKVRLMVKDDGGLALESAPVAPIAGMRAALAATPVSSSDELLRFKTSRREAYARARAERPGVDEVILWNERRELTETCTGNLVLEIEGQRLTPPASSGLLSGTFREHLLEAGEIREQVLPLEALDRASRAFHVNSVRRWVPLELVR